MAKELETALSGLLAWLQGYQRLRTMLGVLLLLGLSALALFCLYQVIPRQFTLRLAGSELVSNRHFLSKALQDEAVQHGIELAIVPVGGSEQALERLSRHQLDLALVQAADAKRYPHLVQVATLPAELLHLLVRPGIERLDQLNGKQVDLGNPTSEWHGNVRRLLAFAGLRANQDFLETNLGQEELMSLPAEQLPDAIATASYTPSLLAEYLVRERGYHLLALPFPNTPGARFDWAEAGSIAANLYGASPAEPPRDLPTVGINLQLLASDAVDPQAIYQLLHTLYSPALAVRMKMRFDESRLTAPSGYPLSTGTQTFIARNHPLLSKENFDKAKALLGLLASTASVLLLLLKWLRGERLEL